MRDASVSTPHGKPTSGCITVRPPDLGKICPSHGHFGPSLGRITNTFSKIIGNASENMWPDCWAMREVFASSLWSRLNLALRKWSFSCISPGFVALFESSRMRRSNENRCVSRSCRSTQYCMKERQATTVIKHDIGWIIAKAPQTDRLPTRIRLDAHVGTPQCGKSHP